MKLWQDIFPTRSSGGKVTPSSPAPDAPPPRAPIVFPGFAETTPTPAPVPAPEPVQMATAPAVVTHSLLTDEEIDRILHFPDLSEAEESQLLAHPEIAILSLVMERLRTKEAKERATALSESLAKCRGELAALSRRAETAEARAAELEAADERRKQRAARQGAATRKANRAAGGNKKA